ncbi:MAG: hypothetical protein OEY14_15505 [Myxococcales bacterium]|nr:hypothetical protein [Myxococcales bacterium]
MIGRAIHAIFSLCCAAALLYVAFFVPLGERTIAEHLRRVASTEEAQELGRELGEAGERLGRQAAADVEARLEESPEGAEPAEGPDSGASGIPSSTEGADPR